MKKLCFGSIFTLLCQIKNSTKNQNWLYYSFVTPNAVHCIEPDSGSVGARKDGRNDIPEAEKDYFNSTNTYEIIPFYRNNLSKLLKSDAHKKAFILALKEVLKADVSLSDMATIGSSAYTKKVIIESETFDFYSLLANLMKYCSSIDNTGFNSNVREISKDFVNNILPDVDSIFLLDSEVSSISSPVSLTIDASKFASVFSEVNANAYSLSIPNPNKVNLYKLRIINNEFDKGPISDFILDNISQYVYSRTKIKDISATHNVRTLSYRAIQELKKNPAFSDQKLTFCEIMLYSFMESTMYSPKILSGYEVNGHGITTKYSSGIYLLPAGTISTNNQIVFGCTQAHDTLKDAIDDVLNQAYDIKTNRNEEIHLLDPSILNTIMDPDISKYIKNLVTPQRGSFVDVDDAFGLFITYSINVPGKGTLSNATYRLEVDKQMDADIKAILPYILSQINRLGLNAYSFYLFILPLDKVETDTKAILSMSIGGGI